MQTIPTKSLQCNLKVRNKNCSNREGFDSEDGPGSCCQEAHAVANRAASSTSKSAKSAVGVKLDVQAVSSMDMVRSLSAEPVFVHYILLYIYFGVKMDHFTGDKIVFSLNYKLN